MNTYNKETEKSEFRIVTHRPDDNKSFIEMWQRDNDEETTFNYALMDLTDKDLVELRDFLNEVV